ncbi:MAG: family 43 glycosylhydrolase [Planctomycetota bacterium]|nr:MAG: family 43 glycosylhydrolase [Planctomycetota bacterium]
MCRRLVYLTILILFLVVGGVGYASPETIVPGVMWYDTSDNILSAHGAGVIKVGDTYYLIGMYMDNDPNNVIQLPGGHTMPLFVGITCYSSTDFANWTFENYILTPTQGGDLDRDNWVGRPKVIYNDTTGQYVMYVNAGKGAGVATCPTVNGNYTYLGSYAPLDYGMGDMTLFKDDDGKAYLIARASFMHIYELTSDYLDVSNLAGTIRDRNAEAPAMFKADGVYYLLVSDSTWWTSNDNYYYTATSIAGPWSKEPADFTPNSDNTFDSQTTYVQPIQGSSTTSYVYLGDRWSEWSFGNSRYIWLPLTVNGTTLTMDWHDFWAIDTATGEWSIPTCTDIEDMHVQSIMCSLVPGSKGALSYGRAAVTIKDNCANPLVGVEVTGTFAGDLNETVVETTGDDGVAVLITTEEARKPSFEICIDDVIGTLPYDSGDNVETCKIFFSFNW